MADEQRDAHCARARAIDSLIGGLRARHRAWHHRQALPRAVYISGDNICTAALALPGVFSRHQRMSLVVGRCGNS